MELLRRLAVLGLLLVGLAGVAGAEYLSESDQTVSVTLAPSLIETDGSTGETTFQLQEGAHDTLTDSTGESVDHYYIWVEVNGEKVLAVDPLWTDYD